MKIIFMGTPDFSVPILEALHKAGHEIIAVYTQPPRPAGRGKKEQPSPVHHRAIALGFPVFHPLNFKNEDECTRFAKLDADCAVVVAYGLILPQKILDAPRLGCLNIHASLLPRWRGAAPIQRAIMAGDHETGIAIMQMEAGLDTGPVLAQEETPIGPQETASTLHDRLSQMGAELIVKTLTKLPLKPVLQAEEGVTYAAKIDKAEARIDWSEGAEVIDLKIRGLSPFPGAWFAYQGERIKVLLSERVEKQGRAGQVCDDKLTISCGEQAVRLLMLQRQGRKPVSNTEFLRGFPIEPGTVIDES